MFRIKKLSKRFVLLSLALLCFLSTLGLSNLQKTFAAGCSGGAISFGTQRWCGYFFGQQQTFGEDVRIGGVDWWVNTTDSFIAMIYADLNSGDPNHTTGASFVVHTMLGYPPGSGYNVDGAMFNEWVNRVHGFSSYGENGAQSSGFSGTIMWGEWWSPGGGCFVNTYWQTWYNDVAPFYDCSGQSFDTIVFRDAGGNELYRIRRICMNPIGQLYALPIAINYDLDAHVNAEITSHGVPVSGNVAEVGDVVRFIRSVYNNGPTPSVGTNCSAYGNNFTGFQATPATPSSSSSGGYSPPPLYCPGSMPLYSTIVSIEEFTITVPNQTLCRSLYVSPEKVTGGVTSDEACIIVTNKPYLKVYGGDVSSGGGVETAPNTCGVYPFGGIISWNQRGAGGWAGAGVQYAAVAANTITDFATALGNSGGATPPTSLAFTNTSTNSAIGNFGGNFDSPKCIPDYYGRKPAAYKTIAGDTQNVSPLLDGDYFRDGDLTITGPGPNGIINPGQRTTVYVDGDVYINTNILYAGSWSTDHIPSFKLVAKGFIYIDPAVVQLDGMYVSQRDQVAATGGTIYTCANGFAAPPLDGSLYNRCRNRLTINGAFVANSVEFLRTYGTRSIASAGENNVNSFAGEIFVFSPALWIAQPGGAAGGSGNYDAITSLPPIL